MADQWDEFEDVGEDASWDDFETIDSTPPPPASKSERTLKDLSMLGGRFDPVGVGETALSIGTSIGSTIGRGLLGMAGTAAGMIPGGESPNEKANRWMNVIPEGTAYQPRTMGGEAGLEMVGKGMEKGVEGVKFAGSGYAAMAGGPQAQRDFMETENALGENVFEKTGSPLLATVAQLLPEVASMGAPVSKVKPRPAPRPRMTPDMPEPGFGGIGTPEYRPMTGQRTPVPETGPGGASIDEFTELRQAVARGDTQRVRDLINANPAIVAAFEELGIEWSPGMVSESAALRQVEGALESVADTGIKQAYANTRSALNEKARALIEQVEGAGSRAGVSTEIKAQFDEIRTGMVNSEKVLYDELAQVVPRGTPVNAKSAADWVMNEARLAGRGNNIDDGLKSLSPHERRLFNMTHERVPVRNAEGKVVGEEWQYTEPQYAAIDRFRKDLGDGMNGQGPFGNANSAELDQLYGRMANIQGRVARENGYGQQWQAANRATVERKGFEDQMRRTLGRDLNYDAIARVDTAARDLLNGRIEKWDQLFKDLPAETKPMAAAQALDKIFFPTKAEMTAKFVDNFNRIKRDPKLRDRLFEHLPDEVRTDFMNFGEAATGFFRQLEDVNFSRTGQARNVVDSLQRPGFMNRVLGGTAETSLGWVPIIGQIIRNVRRSGPDAAAAAEVGRLRAAADLLRDPALRRSIVEYANGNIERANQILKNSQSWLAWAKTQPIPYQRQLEAAGIVALFEENEE